jgi:hypothetical protein
MAPAPHHPGSGDWHSSRSLAQDAQENFMGFVMGTHPRLGENSDFTDSPVELMSAIFEQIDLEPRRANGTGFHYVGLRLTRSPFPLQNRI